MRIVCIALGLGLFVGAVGQQAETDSNTSQNVDFSAASVGDNLFAPMSGSTGSSLESPPAISEVTSGVGIPYFGFPPTADSFSFTPTGQSGSDPAFMNSVPVDGSSGLGMNFGLPITSSLYQVEPNGAVTPEPGNFPTPEPAPFAMFGLASAGLLWRRRPKG